MQGAIVDEIMGGCGTNLQMVTRPQCGNLRWLLQTLTNKWLETMNDSAKGVAGAAAAAAVTACAAPRELPWVARDYTRINFPAPSDDYYEFQDSDLSCGRHALNNLLGGHVFDASAARYDASETYSFDAGSREIRYPIDLHVLCRTIYPDISNANIVSSKETLATYCQRQENYDINLLIAALHMAGYAATSMESQTHILKTPDNSKYNTVVNELFCEPPNTKLIGFIFNIAKNHWIAVKKKGDKYTYLDSLTGKPVAGIHQQTYRKDAFQAYLRNPDIAQIIKVLLPDESTFIDPRKILREATMSDAEIAAAAAIANLKAASKQALADLFKQLTTDAERTAYTALKPVLEKGISFTESPEQDLAFNGIMTNAAILIPLFGASPKATNMRERLLAIQVKSGNYSANILAVLSELTMPLFTLRIPLHLLSSE
jgi:hypothetical protein